MINNKITSLFWLTTILRNMYLFNLDKYGRSIMTKWNKRAASCEAIATADDKRKKKKILYPIININKKILISDNYQKYFSIYSNSMKKKKNQEIQKSKF